MVVSPVTSCSHGVAVVGHGAVVDGVAGVGDGVVGVGNGVERAEDVALGYGAVGVRHWIVGVGTGRLRGSSGTKTKVSPPPARARIS